VKVKTLLIIIALLLVAWVGSNYARGKEPFSNPFAKKTWSEKANDAVNDVLGK
jgi:hypothetical protein